MMAGYRRCPQKKPWRTSPANYALPIKDRCFSRQYRHRSIRRCHCLHACNRTRMVHGYSMHDKPPTHGCPQFCNRMRSHPKTGTILLYRETGTDASAIGSGVCPWVWGEQDEAPIPPERRWVVRNHRATMDPRAEAKIALQEPRPVPNWHLPNSWPEKHSQRSPGPCCVSSADGS